MLKISRLTVFGPTIFVSELDDIKFVGSQESEGNIDAIGLTPEQWEFLGNYDSVFTNHGPYRRALNKALSKTNISSLFKDIQNLENIFFFCHP